ncbi:MAG: hypothetical protein ACLFVU_10255 [Phycisphaerae bacterium]
MEILTRKRFRLFSGIVTICLLLILAVGLAAMLWISLVGMESAEAESNRQRGFASLAMISGGLLLMTMGMLAWAGIRLIGRKTIPDSKRVQRTQHVDAWAEAGRRFELPEDDEDETDPSNPDRPEE